MVSGTAGSNSSGNTSCTPTAPQVASLDQNRSGKKENAGYLVSQRVDDNSSKAEAMRDRCGAIARWRYESREKIQGTKRNVDAIVAKQAASEGAQKRRFRQNDVLENPRMLPHIVPFLIPLFFFSFFGTLDLQRATIILKYLSLRGHPISYLSILFVFFIIF